MLPREKIVPDVGSSFRVLQHHVKAEEFTWQYHYHREAELVFVLEGNGRRHVGSHISYFENGDLVLIGPNLPHSGFGYGARDYHNAIVVQFDVSLFDGQIFEGPELSSIKHLLKKATSGIAFSEETRGLIAKDFEKLINYYGSDRLFLLVKILKILAEDTDFDVLNPHFNGHIDQDRLSKIFGFVEKNYHHVISSFEVAEHCNLTHPAFCNYFKKQVGQNFTDFLNEYRVKKACEFLAQGQNVTEVAFAVGFESLAYFSRVFKNEMKLSPRDYKKTLHM